MSEAKPNYQHDMNKLSLTYINPIVQLHTFVVLLCHIQFHMAISDPIVLIYYLLFDSICSIAWC